MSEVVAMGIGQLAVTEILRQTSVLECSNPLAGSDKTFHFTQTEQRGSPWQEAVVRLISEAKL
jgi:hypothetical protein